MVVTTIEYITEGGQRTERDISSTRFSVKIAGEYRSPAVTREVEIENNGDQSVSRDQCGNIERRRQSNDGWAVRVTGIVTSNDVRRDNLSLQKLRDVVANMDSVEIVSDVTSGEYTVSNTVITEANDLVSVQTPDTDGREQAFEFNLQLGDTESSN